MNGLLQDLRYAFRQFRRSPGFTCTSALILALGMGSSLSIFAFVDAALIKPLPYPDSNRLVEVTESVAILPRANLSYPDYLAWKKLNHVFTSMDVYHRTGYLLSTAAGAEPAPFPACSPWRDFPPVTSRRAAPPMSIPWRRCATSEATSQEEL